MEKRLFADLGLSPELLKAVDKMGFEEASPIQTAVIPVALTGKDIVGRSATGSGKTAAYGIPVVERTEPKLRRVQALILCPTRELTVQVAEEFAKISFFKHGVHSVPIYGGQSYERQYRALEAGTQIIIGTPGRIMDHMERGSLKLDDLKVLVLDEADRMLDMGFRDDIEHILSAIPKERQLLFFSATMPAFIQDMIGRYSHDPAWIEVAMKEQNAPQVEQVFYEVDRRSKAEALVRVIEFNDFRYGIIFCSTKIMVDDLEEHLHNRGFSTDRLHGDISQAQRERVMDKFHRRGFEFLVATDVAARGLDVDDLEVVFNYDLPNDAEDYTHRIGRTGRAGRSGHAFTFVSGREIYKLEDMARYAKLQIRRGHIPSIDQIEEARENVFFERLRATLDAKEFQAEDRMIDRLLEQGYSSTDIAAALLHLLQNPSATPDVSKGAAAAKTPATAVAAPKAPAAAVAAPKAKAVRPAPAWAAAVASQVVAPQTPAPVSEPAVVSAAPTPEITPPPSPVAAAPSEIPASDPAPAPTPEPAPAHKHAPAHAKAPKAEHKATVAHPHKTAVKHAAKAQVAAEDAEEQKLRPTKAKLHRPQRTGRDPKMTTLFFNVGQKNGVTPADLVGKIAGVTRLPAEVVGAIDVHTRHSLVDVSNELAQLILKKLNGVRVKGEALRPLLATVAPAEDLME